MPCVFVTAKWHLASGKWYGFAESFSFDDLLKVAAHPIAKTVFLVVGVFNNC